MEPIHVLISRQGSPSADATKLWITRVGKCILCHNNSHIPAHILRNLIGIIEARSGEIKAKWLDYFGEIAYVC